MTAKKLKPQKLWCGRIPEIYGYGLIVLECTEAEARKTLRREFQIMKKSFHGEMSFPKAMDYFGGTVIPVETGKAYYDNLGS